MGRKKVNFYFKDKFRSRLNGHVVMRKLLNAQDYPGRIVISSYEVDFACKEKNY